MRNVPCMKYTFSSGSAHGIKHVIKCGLPTPPATGHRHRHNNPRPRVFRTVSKKYLQAYDLLYIYIKYFLFTCMYIQYYAFSHY